MADTTGNATVFETLACREFILGKGSRLSTPSTSADDLMIYGESDNGITIFSTTTGGIYFGDVANSSAGRISYNHASDYFGFKTNNSEVFYIDVNGCIQLKETVDTTPTLITSGAIFVSGGAIWAKGFENTYTKLAAA